MSGDFAIFMKKIAIIGGGISGLSAAYFLQENIPDTEISLFEEKPRLGGVIETQTRHGFLLEAGPDCFLSKKPAARDLCKQIGLSNELIPTREGFRRSFIYLKGKLQQVPAGFYLMAPGKISTLMALPHLSVLGKLRAACDLLAGPGRGLAPLEADESVASFIRRRFGREVFERIGQPMIGGIYGGDPEKLSLRATLPQFLEMEQKYGSVIRGLRREQNEAHETASGPRYSLFLSMKEGMEQMIRGLRQELTRVKFFTACGIKSVWHQSGAWHLLAEDGRAFKADALLIALPACAAAKLIRGFAAKLSETLDSIPYESVATVNLVYKKKDIPETFKGLGFVAPKIEKTRLSACTYSSLKFEGRVPEDHALLRAFVGGALYRGEFLLDDQAMEEMVRGELKKILGLDSRPLVVSIRRYPNAMPQYEVGHLEKVAAIRRQLQDTPGLFLTGNAYDGIGIPDCIEQAENQAKKILAYAVNKS